MNKGYIAITSVLMIAGTAIAIGIAVTLASVSEVQTALTGMRREAVLDLIDSCIEVSQYSINTQDSLSASVILPFGSCTVTTNSHVGITWTYTVSASLNGFTKTVQVITTRSGTLTPNSWKET